MQRSKREILRHSGIAIIAVMVIVFFFCNATGGVMSKVEKRFFDQRMGYVEKIEKNFNISSEPSVLYLDAGSAPFYIRANSSGRYICPLPLQRDGPGWNLTGIKAFRRTLQDALDYNGTYIIWEGSVGPGDWLHSEYPNRAPLMEKLKREYTVVWSEGWTIFKRS